MLTKIAVGIFAGGVVFATFLPEVSVRVGSATLNAFWIGSVIVILLTGLYTVTGGMRAVAYIASAVVLLLIASAYWYVRG